MYSNSKSLFIADGNKQEGEVLRLHFDLRGYDIFCSCVYSFLKWAPSSSSSEYSTLKAIYLFIDILDDYLFMAYLLESVAYLKCNIQL
jgi:hypothetical protein